MESSRHWVVRCCLAGLSLLLVCPGASGKSLDVRVVDFNLWGLPWGISEHRAARIERIGPALAKLKPDLVALQEVWVPADGEVLIKALADAGLTHAHHEHAGLLGSGLLVASRWPLEAITFRPFTLTGKLHKPYHGDAWARKGALRVLVKTPAGPLLFTNTHLHARYGSTEYLPVQVGQALEVADLVGAHGAQPPELLADNARPPLILAGDLNSERAELPFRLLTSRAGLAVPRKRELRIDWVLTRDGGALRVAVRRIEHVLEGEVDLGDGTKAPLSDHPGVLAVLRLRSGSPKPAAVVWEPTRAEALELVRAEDAAAAERGGGARRLAFFWLLLAGGLFGVDRLLRRKRKTAGCAGCLLGAGALLILHLATWELYFGAVHEPSLQNGLRRAMISLRAAD